MVVAVLGAGIAVNYIWDPFQGPTVTVVHWTNSHLMPDGLLPKMAEQFNKEGHRTKSGERIKVDVFVTGSPAGAADLLSRAVHGLPIKRDMPDPVIFTPHVDHWLVQVNHRAGRTIVDLENTESIARSFIGIITYRDMAECLGWPEKKLGYADIIALRADPEGWAKYDCAKSEWGQRPLVSFTDPTTSSTGRSVLFTLYSLAAGKPPEELTPDDVAKPEVTAYVKDFQGLVDHYMPTSLVLNTKIYQGPRHGHFFLMAEDNLIHLTEDTVSAVINGQKAKAPAITKPMVMIYPTEGSTASAHCACMIQADWVSEEQAEGADEWVAYLREEAQQRIFMAKGFRPATGLPLTDPISVKYGLDPSQPTEVFNTRRIDPAVAEAIDKSWADVKRQGIVTFGVDTSGSMLGAKLRQTKHGMADAVLEMAAANQVGFISFGDQVEEEIAVRPINENRAAIENAIDRLRPQGGTALYDAIRRGVEMTDAAPGDADAIRGVVVLTDGGANRGTVWLNDLVRMMSTNEVEIGSCRDIECSSATGNDGWVVDKTSLIGIELAIKTRHSVQIFFIGIGDDADMEVGRLLAEATGAEFRGVLEEDLNNVLAQFGKYF